MDETDPCQGIFRNMPEAVFRAAPDGRLEAINPAGAALLGLADTGSGLGRDILELLFPSPAERKRVTDTLSRHGRITRRETTPTRPDGSELVIEVSLWRVDDDQGQLTAVEGFFRDATGDRRVETELRRVKEEAETANRAKTRLLANVSHELRTPINGIIGLSQLAAEAGVPDQQRELLDMIGSSARDLMLLVNDLSELTTMESGSLRLIEREFDPSEEFEPLLRNFKAQSQWRNFSFAYAFDPAVPERLIGDPNRTKQILINLIGNAFKYTVKGAVSVRIGLWEKDAPGPHGEPESRSDRLRLYVTVRDTGIGIDPARRHDIFEPFCFAGEGLDRQTGGAGLGLAISRRLARMMGGDITCESTPGRGCVFTLSVGYGLTEPRRPSRPARTEAAAESERSRLSVLLAEDEPINRIFTVRALEKLGHQVKTAADGREALTMLSAEPFDLVLMDIQMPRLSGLDATRLIRAGQVPGANPRIPIVALTAYAMESDRVRGMEAGMDEYVTKPFEIPHLVSAMKRALSRN